MGRMGITNTIMLLQVIFLYTFSSDDSLNAVNKISFYVDIAYRIALCVWLLLMHWIPLCDKHTLQTYTENI